MKGRSLLALSSHISENIYNKIDGNIINTYSLPVCVVVPLIASEVHILRLHHNSVANDSTSLRPLEHAAAQQSPEQPEVQDHKIMGELQAQVDIVRSYENSQE